MLYYYLFTTNYHITFILQLMYNPHSPDSRTPISIKEGRCRIWYVGRNKIR